MDVGVEIYGAAVVLAVQGELTEETLAPLREEIRRQLDDDIVDVVLDLERVTTLDSCALEFLVDLQDQLIERLGQVRLLRPDENVAKILEMTRLRNTFEIFQDTSEAVATLGH
jgi:anti-anti-sigma factor